MSLPNFGKIAEILREVDAVVASSASEPCKTDLLFGIIQDLRRFAPDHLKDHESFQSECWYDEDGEWSHDIELGRQAAALVREAYGDLLPEETEE